MKTENKDTSKIYLIQKELDCLLQSNSVVNDEIKNKSKQLLYLNELRKKEDKGFNRVLIFTFICFAFAVFTSVLLLEKNSEQKWYVDKLSEFMNIKKDSIDDSMSLYYRTYNGAKLTYDQLGEQKDSLEIASLENERNCLLEKIKNDSLSRELWKYKTVYELSNKQYGITMKYSEIKTDGKVTMRAHIDAAKIDSAFLLLPKYGNKIRYNKTNNAWTVE